MRCWCGKEVAAWWKTVQHPSCKYRLPRREQGRLIRPIGAVSTDEVLRHIAGLLKT